jgi:Helix-turn-helix domain
MSFEAVAWAARQKAVPKGCKFLLVMLSQFCDDNWECWYRQSVLAEATQQSRTTVNRQLQVLETDGWIRREAQCRPNGLRKCDRFTVCLDRPGSLQVPTKPSPADSRCSDLKQLKCSDLKLLSCSDLKQQEPIKEEPTHKNQEEDSPAEDFFKNLDQPPAPAKTPTAQLAREILNPNSFEAPNKNPPPAPPVRGADETDVDFFWRLAKGLEARGVEMSISGKILKLQHNPAQSIRTLYTGYRAKKPEAYLGATAHRLAAKTKAAAPKEAPSDREPSPPPGWVTQERDVFGAKVTWLGPNRWKDEYGVIVDDNRQTEEMW